MRAAPDWLLRGISHVQVLGRVGLPSRIHPDFPLLGLLSIEEPGYDALTMTEQKPGPRGVRNVVGLLEHGQDYLSAAVGVVLLVMAVAVLAGAIADFCRSLLHADVEAAVNALLDRVLLTLILVEIVHTVVLSLRAHHLVAQPLIVVGLVATIRKVLFVLSGPSSVSTATLALLLAMVVVFVAAFFLVSRVDTGDSLPRWVS